MSTMAPNGRYLADVNHSSVIWRIKHLGLAWYTARFTRFEAELEFLAEAPERMRLRAEVDLASVRAEYQGTDKDWDRNLAEGEEFFDALRHPKATFVSAEVRRTGESTASVMGDLVFRGVTRPLTFETRFNGALVEHRSGRPHIGFSATATLRRSEHGLTFYLGPLMPDEVQIIVETQMGLAA